MAQLLFPTASVVALIAWLLLIAAPRRPLVLALVLYGGVVLLCLAYTIALGWVLAHDGGGGGGVDFTRISGVRAIFASDAGAAIGWTHYLAFDLFAGLWIARDADAKGFSRWVQTPFLLLALIAGPAGLLGWMIVRERRARAAGWKRGGNPSAG